MRSALFQWLEQASVVPLIAENEPARAPRIADALTQITHLATQALAIALTTR